MRNERNYVLELIKAAYVYIIITIIIGIIV